MIDQDLEIVNKLGLHARAAAKFVSCASGFSSEIIVEKKGQKVNGKSIMGVMMLAASKGTHIKVQIAGSDEEIALQALKTLVGNCFGEPE
ncbi:MAG: HPr family phosphocarrier protein [Pseudomonadota bacterium]